MWWAPDRAGNGGLAAALLLGAVLLALPPSADASTAEVDAVADTYVDASHPRRAGGRARVLRLSEAPVRRGYVRFDLGAATAPVSSATLRLYVRGRAGGRVTAHAVRGTAGWSERRTTFATAPAFRRRGVRSRRLRRSGWVAIDVTRLLRGDRELDVALSGAPAARVSSREGARPPRLGVVLAPPPPFSPGPPVPPPLHVGPPTPSPPPSPPRPPAPALLTVVLDAEPDSPQDFSFATVGAGLADFTLDDDGDPTRSERRVLALTGTGFGTKVVAQPRVAGWDLAELSCTGDADAVTDLARGRVTLGVDPGERILCRFVNRRQATVTVVQAAHPRVAQDFVFGGGLGTFGLDDDDDPVLPGRRSFTPVAFGALTIAQVAVAGWSAPEVACTGDAGAVVGAGGAVSLDVDPGEDIECRFVNEASASLTIVHDAEPDSGEDFRFTLSRGPVGELVLDDDDEAAQPGRRTVALAGDDVGALAVAQDPVAGWSLTTLSCTGDADAAADVPQRRVVLGVDPGESVECRFVVTQDPGPLPSVVGGVYPESSSFIGPFQDGNGNLYTVTELSADEPRPCIRKSTDGGRTWTEVDAGNRPLKEDLESLWLVQDGTRIHLLHQRSGESSPKSVFYHSFNTSDAPVSPDSWQVRDELVHDPVGGGDQAVALVQRSNGDLIAFYRTQPAGMAQRIGYKVKPSGGTWGEESILDSGPPSFTQAVAVMGAGDVAHVFYKNDTDNTVLYRRLSPTGSLSGADRVSDFGTHTSDHIIASPPVRLTVGDTERIAVAWKRSTGATLDGVLIDDGVIGPEHALADLPVDHNPSRVTSLQTVATLAADDAADRTLAPYSDLATNDLYLATHDGAEWGVDAEIVDDTDVDIVSASVFMHAARNGGRRVLGLVYDDATDVAPGADNVVRYTEAPLGD